jgi:hypothetical protein
VLEWNPEVPPRREYLEARADARVGVRERPERAAVQRARRRTRRDAAVGIVSGPEHLLPDALGVQRGPVEERAHFRLAAGSGEHVELLLGPLMLPGKAQQLEEECPPLGVGRIAPEPDAQQLDRLFEFARAQQLVSACWRHGLRLSPLRAS